MNLCHLNIHKFFNFILIYVTGSYHQIITRTLDQKSRIDFSVRVDRYTPVTVLHMDFRQSLLHGPAKGSRTKSVELFNGQVIELCRKAPTDFSQSINISNEKAVIDIPQLLQDIEESDRRRKNRLRVVELTRQESLEATSKKHLKHNQSSNDSVWTEKYRPRSYLQICTAGNDRALRQMMHWLTLFKSQEETASDRVHKKILLVHGPAGIGKTTAAHALPRQARYNVVELNAATSFDSVPGVSVAATIRLRIINALTMNQISTSASKNMMATRPTCLVIDELDTSIHANEIVRVLEQLSKGTIIGNGKSKHKFVLNRPVICIANDLYATSTSISGPTFSSTTGKRFGSPMERLRPLCEAVAFRRPVTGTRINSGTAIKTLKDHLVHIAEQEHLNLSSRDVSDIVTVCDGDIRACINHLQFHGGSSCSENTNSSIDAVPHWFNVVDDTFKRDLKVTRAANFARMLNFYTSGSGRAAVSVAHAKIMRGCFQRYLDAVTIDEDTLVKPAQLSEWLKFYDCYISGSLSSVLADSYVSIVWLKLWSLFNTNAKIDSGSIANGRNADFAATEDGRRNNNTISAIRERVALATRLALGSELWAAVVVPWFYRMIYLPESESGSAQISQAALLATALGLELSTSYDPDSGRDVIVWVPDLELVVTFGLNQTKRWLLSALAKEISNVAAAAAALKSTENSNGKSKRKAENGVAPPKRHRIQLFGASDKVATPNGNSTVKPARTWVKYHEGFSNAVRKNIGWDDLWK